MAQLTEYDVGTTLMLTERMILCNCRKLSHVYARAALIMSQMRPFIFAICMSFLKFVNSLKSNVWRIFTGGSPSPNSGYVPSSSFSPTRRHEAVTSSDAAGTRFSFWPEGDNTLLFK